MGALNIITTQTWGTLQLSPPQDNYEVAIGFYRYANKRVSNAGDAWLIGPGLWGNSGSFVIGTGSISACLTINTSGVVNIPYSLSINGTDVMSKFNSYAPLASPTFTGTVSGITASMVGLGNVNNTSDLNKPISTATQAALNLLANNLAPLASPTFTGTATAPTINATTALQVGGIDISTIYQTISNMTNYITSSSLATTLGSYAPLASPTFTGTATAPTVNATTSIQVGGIDISTIYQKISNMTKIM
jgi:hypothetical protein